MTDYFVVEPCASSNGFEIKLKKKIDLKKAEVALGIIGKTLASTPIVLLAKIDQYPLSIYASGRMLIKSDKKMTERQATQVAKKILDAFEKTGAIK